MKTRLLLVTALVLMLAMPVAVFAQEGPGDVAGDFTTSINEGAMPH